VNSKIKIGLHISIAERIDLAVDRAKKIGCGTFQIFTRNPRGWNFKDLEKNEINNFINKTKRMNFSQTLAHMPYLPNLASSREEVYLKSVEALIIDLRRTGLLGIPYLVTHLGSHLGSGKEKGIVRIVSACEKALNEVNNKVLLLFENTAGQKNSMGDTFKEIKDIIEKIDLKERIGVCFDTCHAFASGYDLRSQQAVDKTLSEFDKHIGLDLLKAVHLNDARGDLGSNLDRHEHIGFGQIGETGFKAFLQSKLIKKLPIILETPIDGRCDDYGNLLKATELAE